MDILKLLLYKLFGIERYYYKERKLFALEACICLDEEDEKS